MLAEHPTVQDIAEQAARTAHLDAERILFQQQKIKEVENTRIQRLTANEHELHVAGHLADMRFSRASDVDHRIYHFYGPVDGESVRVCREHLTRWARLAPAEPVEIVLTTGGGSAWDCMALVDDMLALEAKGLDIGVTVRGTAASAGAIILQAATPGRRKMGPSSTILIHKMNTVLKGSLDQIEDQQHWCRIMQERVYDLFAERCASAPNADPEKRLDRAAIVAGHERRDWVEGPQSAREQGLIDDIG